TERWAEDVHADRNPRARWRVRVGRGSSTTQRAHFIETQRERRGAAEEDVGLARRDPEDAAQADHTFDIRRSATLGFQILVIGRQQGDEVPAGRMADEEELIGIAAVFGDVVLGPSKSAGDILNVLGMFYER